MRFKNIIILFFIIITGERTVLSDSTKFRFQLNDENQSLIANNRDSIIIHIVKEGDTLSSISKLYSIDKQMIIDANNLENENYIYIGQNLKITENNESSINKDFHEIQKGDNLTEISIMYGISIRDLIEINNLENPNSLVVGNKIIINKDFFTKNGMTNIEDINESTELNLFDYDIYGPLTVNSDSLIVKQGKRLLNATHANGQNLIIALQCHNSQINVRKKGQKWQGWEQAEKDFEIKLLKDYC